MKFGGLLAIDDLTPTAKDQITSIISPAEQERQQSLIVTDFIKLQLGQCI